MKGYAKPLHELSFSVKDCSCICTISCPSNVLAIKHIAIQIAHYSIIGSLGRINRIKRMLLSINFYRTDDTPSSYFGYVMNFISSPLVVA